MRCKVKTKKETFVKDGVFRVLGNFPEPLVNFLALSLCFPLLCT